MLRICLAANLPGLKRGVGGRARPNPPPHLQTQRIMGLEGLRMCFEASVPKKEAGGGGGGHGPPPPVAMSGRRFHMVPTAAARRDALNPKP